jgi:hypothetical protein
VVTYTERAALEAARHWFRRQSHRARDVRHQTIGLVQVEERFGKDSLALVQAALLAGIPDTARDVKFKAVHACSTIQIQLIWSGWQELLDGYYAAATSKCRLIAELSDFIVAASVSEIGAQRLLDSDDDFWKAGHVRQYIQKNMITDPGEAEAWGDAQRELHDELNQFAHVGAGLLSTVMHVGDEAIFLGHKFNATALRAGAAEYAQLAVAATRAIATAVGANLLNDGAWSESHEDLLMSWQPYRVALDERLDAPNEIEDPGNS